MDGGGGGGGGGSSVIKVSEGGAGPGAAVCAAIPAATAIMSAVAPIVAEGR